MPKFVIRGEKQKETPIEVWLEQNANGYIFLMAQNGNGSRVLVRLNPDGTLFRGVARIDGIQTDHNGRILLEETP